MKFQYLAGVALVVALAGCTAKVDVSTGGNNTSVAAPAPAPAPAAGGNETAGGEEAVPAADGAKQDFEILNKTGHTVVSFNVSPVSENEWGSDILGKDVLNDGESAKITFPHGADKCKWDLRATYDDDDTTEMKSVDLCKTATVTLNP